MRERYRPVLWLVLLKLGLVWLLFLFLLAWALSDRELEWIAWALGRV